MSGPHVDTKCTLIWNLMAGWEHLYNPIPKGTVETSLMGLIDHFEPLEASVILYTMTIICKSRYYERTSLQSFKPKSMLSPQNNIPWNHRLVEHTALLWESCLVNFTSTLFFFVSFLLLSHNKPDKLNQSRQFPFFFKQLLFFPLAF